MSVQMNTLEAVVKPAPLPGTGTAAISLPLLSRPTGTAGTLHGARLRAAIWLLSGLMPWLLIIGLMI